VTSSVALQYGFVASPQSAGSASVALHLSDRQDDAAAAYAVDGFTGLADLFGEDDLLRLGAAIERAARRRAAVDDPYFARLDTENSLNASFRQYANLHEQDDELAAFALSARLAGVAQRIAGEELCFLFSSALEKRPFAGPLRAHHDLRQMPFESAGMITLWIPLDDVDARNGCLYYLPGTHRMGVARAKDSARESFKDSSIDYLEFYREFADVQPVFGELSRGSALLHNGMTIHGSGANISRSGRRAFALSYIPVDTVCLVPEHPLLRGIAAGARFSSDPRHPAVARA